MVTCRDAGAPGDGHAANEENDVHEDYGGMGGGDGDGDDYQAPDPDAGGAVPMGDTREQLGEAAGQVPAWISGAFEQRSLLKLCKSAQNSLEHGLWHLLLFHAGLESSAATPAA